MPDERFTHRKEGRSRKLSLLTDFEFRVWSQYRLSANDFGVMLYSPAPLVSENKNFETRSARAIRVALDRMVEIGLLLAFEDQGEQYVCSAEWQEYQTVCYPRQTHLPIPNGEALATCSAATRALFDVNGFRSANRKVRSQRRAEAAKGRSGKIPGIVLEHSKQILGKRSTQRAVSSMPLAEDPPVAPRDGGRKETRAERKARTRLGLQREEAPWRIECRRLGHQPPCGAEAFCLHWRKKQAAEDVPA